MGLGGHKEDFKQIYVLQAKMKQYHPPVQSHGGLGISDDCFCIFQCDRSISQLQ